MKKEGKKEERKGEGERQGYLSEIWIMDFSLGPLDEVSPLIKYDLRGTTISIIPHMAATQSFNGLAFFNWFHLIRII